MATTSSDTPEAGLHACTVDAALDALQSSRVGLDEPQVLERRRRFGENRLPEPPRRGPVVRFLRHFHNVLIYVLIGSATITLLLGHLADTVVIVAVVIANAIIGFIQEGKAERAMEAIRGMLAPGAAVLRAGERRSVSGTELVPGDIVLLEAGDRVPADLRLIESHGTRIEEAVLTGESVPVDKDTEPSPVHSSLGDRHGMAYSGTLVVAGQCRGAVVATGARTEIGRISGLLDAFEELTTPLVRQMDGFARALTALILAVSVLLLLFGYFVRHFPFAEIFMVVVGLAVAAIPEGLPAVLTITLAIGVRAMASRHAIVRRLPAIETVGAVSVICTDKTGTLTRNEMSVATVCVAHGSVEVVDTGYRADGTIADPGGVLSETLRRDIAVVAVLCNEASLTRADEEWDVEGDPMEGALLVLAGKAGVQWRDERARWMRVGVIAFDARHRYMATRHQGLDGRVQTSVKGAPEQLLAMCRLQRSADGGVEPLDPEGWQARAEAIAARGQRVLALACGADETIDARLEPAALEGNLVLLGLVGMIDPPRAEAVSAVADCLAAGISVKMITGDHAATARSIAREIGLVNTREVLSGADLDRMDDAALAQAVLRTDVFARTSPEHKLRLVHALQSHRLTVAMTGDGVNDAPALKRADVGIAMGRKGTEAAREASQLVLADDHFASIAAAVREGRTVYDNLRKVISWTLPTNAGEAMTIIVALLLGMALPVTPVQILWINLITAVTLGLALAFEPTEAGTMRRAPRARDEPLLGRELAWHIVLVSALFVAGVFGIYAHAIEQGYPVELARTLALNTLVVMEIFHLFFIRNLHGTSLTWAAVRGTPVVWTTVLAVTGAQLAITYLPPLQAIFGTQAVPFLDGLLVVGIGVALLAVLEIEKQVRLRLYAASGA